ncbi:FUSC family protein [Shewanella mangrovi]|uniref:FUSC family protein n=1 Tax=Shewanella mangrovi TaxID=1515746 RepID=UPI001F4CE6B2|nr:FUSC family protein [Shewanella mangrovi]
MFEKATRLSAFIYRYARIVHTFKIALALGLVALVNGFWPVPHFIWSMVTIVIIMMGLPQVGGAIEKSMQRAVGTLLGASYGVLLVIFIDQYWHLMGLLILGVTIVCYLNAGRYSYAYLVTGFTMIIVIGDANHDTSAALWRTANILIGCVVAVLVSLFVLPIKAKQDWRAQMAKTFSMMAKVLDAHLNHDGDSKKARSHLENAMKAVLAQKKLMFSLEWESQTLKKHAATVTELADEQVRVITLLELLLQSKLNEEQHPALPQIQQFAQIMQQHLLELADYLSGKVDKQPLLPAGFSYQLEQQLIALQQREHTHDSESAQRAFSLNGYSWLIFQLALALTGIHTQLDKLIAAYRHKARLLATLTDSVSPRGNAKSPKVKANEAVDKQE